MNNKFKVELINEPNLEFGSDFLSSDPKTGITIGGFFSETHNSHRSQIHYSIIGTNIHIETSKDWIKRFEEKISATIQHTEGIVNNEIDIIDGEIVENEEEVEGELSENQLSNIFFDEAQNINPNKEEETFLISRKLNPDFPGFSNNSVFKCSFENHDSNNKAIKANLISNILDDKELPDFDKVVKIADLYINAYTSIIEDSISKPNICFIIIPKNVFKKLSSIKYVNGKYFNLRRYLKAQLISVSNAIPVQIILEDTINGTKKSLQDLSMQAWNFTIANYYKNGGIPYTLNLKDKNACFIGISFHKVIGSSQNLLRSSIAQAFNYEGKGIIFIGKQFDWDSEKTNTPAPHLTYEYANELIKNVLAEYKKYNKISPSRVVIHKTTDFWDSAIHAGYAEAEGFRYGITEALGEEVEIDLVTIKSSNIKILRSKGDYPVLRGTLLKMSEKFGLLYTTGFIPYYETFPGVHIPKGFEISIYSGDSTIRKVCEEIIALTKLNFNNCSYFDSLPITIRFAQKVGEILQYIPDGITAPNKYFYYM